MIRPQEIDKSWREVLSSEFSEPYFLELCQFVQSQYEQHIVFPPRDQIFRAFNETPFHKVRVVILGQDPYHGPNQANGLCFSVNPGVKFPRSLANIFKEIEQSNISLKAKDGDLSSWAKQGVFLLNTTLTVQAGKAGSHHRVGWEIFTDAVINALGSQKNGLVYMLWGSHAQKKGRLIPEDENLVLKSVHPSPLSAYRGFFGCGHFIQANNYLIAKGRKPIRW